MAEQIFTKRLLSGSTDGEGILIVATATPGTLIHTAAAIGALDEVWLFFTNTQAAALKVTLEWGGVTVPNHIREISVPGESGALCMIPGFLLTNAKVIRAFCGTTNLVVVDGFVNRITG